jgi:hypothetical protein
MNNTVHFPPLAVAVLVGSLTAFTPRTHAQGGVPLWTNRYERAGRPQAIAVDTNGNVFVTGGDLEYVTTAYSGAGVPLWTNRYDSQGYVATAVAVDGSGNVFVTGSANGAYVTIKYSNAGVPLWTNLYHEPGHSGGANAIAADSNANVFVTGRFDRDPPSSDYLTIAYTGAGVPIWTNRYGTTSYSSATAVAVDGSGNVIVTGLSYGTVYDYATIKYSGAGVPLWTNRYNGQGHNEAYAVTVDGSGNVLVTGESDGTGTSPWPDYATIKYSAAGVPLWTNRYNGPENGNNRATAIAVDSSGNVLVTGLSGSPSYSTIATIKYSSEGLLLWANYYDGPGAFVPGAPKVAMDGIGNVFVAGTSARSGGGYDYAAIAYSGSGVPLWTSRYHELGNGDDYASGIAVDGNGNVFVTGYSFDGTNGFDFVTIKYSSSMPVAPRLDFGMLDNQLVLSWTNAGFSLQCASPVTGTFTNIPGATSPYTNPITAPQQFFRLAR